MRKPPSGALPASASWLDELPSRLSLHADILRGLVLATVGDPRFRAMQVHGSVGRGTGDRWSDLDVGTAVAADRWTDIVVDLPAIVGGTGDVVDGYYEFQPRGRPPQALRAFIQFRNGVQLDLLVVPTSEVMGSGPYGRTLYDPDGLFLRTDDPNRLLNPQDIPRWVLVCWGALTETAKNVARNRPVAAIEWLNSARAATISCWAALHDLDYASQPIMAAAATEVDGPWLDGLEKTYPEPVSSSVGAAALQLAHLQNRVDALLLDRFQLPRRPWASWVTQRLEQLQAAGQRPDNRPETHSHRGRARAASRRSTRRQDGHRAR